MEGKENNDDFLSNGEWKGKLSSPSREFALAGNGVQRCSVNERLCA